MKRLKLSHGIAITTFEKPPSDFDFASAKPKELTRYGLPLAPGDSRQKRRYENAMRELVGKFRYLEPTFDVPKTRGRHQPKRLPQKLTQGDDQTNNWCGGEVEATAIDSFKYVTGEFTVPNVSSPSGPETFFSSHWVGLGQTSILQMGVECNGLAHGKSDIYPWWQWLPGAIVTITNFKVTSGDMLQIMICSDSGTGSKAATMYLTNRITGVFTSFGVEAPDGVQLDGGWAEWISEIPEIDGITDPIYLADFGQVYFSNCVAGTVNNSSMSSGDGNRVDMLSSDNSTVVCEGVQLASDVVRSIYLGPIPEG
jgi:Peptidase A4 family